MNEENANIEQVELQEPIQIDENLLLKSTLLKNATPEQIARGRIGRNEICPCGSGKKFKKCCYRIVR